MNLLAVLRESLVLVRKQPKVFIPKLVTTAFYSFYTIWAASLTLRVYALSRVGAVEELSPLLQETMLLFVFIIFLYFMDLVSYSMYPRIVSDYLKKKPVSLTAALASAMSVWKVILSLGALIFLFLLTVMAVAVFVQVMSLTLSTPLLIWLLAPFVILSILIFSVLVFFVIPIAVVEKKSLISSFVKSFSLGLKYKGDLLKVNLFFLAMALVTLAIGILSESTGLVAFVSLAAFVGVRLIQAVVYTYMSVVNPYFYMRVRKTH